MAHSLSTKKRVRQNAKAAEHNRALKTRIKTIRKSFLETAKSGAKREDLEKSLRSAVAQIQKIANKGVIHRNRAARLVSLLSSKLNPAA